MGNFCFLPSKFQSTTIIRKSTSGDNGKANASITSSISNADNINGQILEVPNLRIYTFYELRSATRNFKLDPVIGGSFCMVYKGWVDRTTLNPTKSGQGIVVAVKKLNPESIQGLEEWEAEVDYLGRLAHPNLVKLMGYCLEDIQLLLVYEYTSKGSLEDHLFRRATDRGPLSWNKRLKILIGTASGLSFLHSLDKQVIFRDFKASNVLLDSRYNPKLSDFGIAKNGQDFHAAPENVATGHLCAKGHVYGFGVVLLEMLTGLRAVDHNRPKEMENLVEWAKPYLLNRRKLTDVVMDKRLEGQYNPKAALQAAQLTLHCLADDHRKRPSMHEVVDILLNVKSIVLANQRS